MQLLRIVANVEELGRPAVVLVVNELPRPAQQTHPALVLGHAQSIARQTTTPEHTHEVDALKLVRSLDAEQRQQRGHDVDQLHRVIEHRVHNVFIHDDHIYALSAGRRYDIINIEDPSKPNRVGRFELDTPGHSIHDVWVDDGIAYSSNWDDGIVAVDVGGGNAGGSPRNPVKLGSYTYPSGWNHAAFPYRSKSTGKLYAFAGDESTLSGVIPRVEGLDMMAGYIHIIEWDSWDEPREVARYRVPDGGSHNIWVEDDVLYVAYYQGGLRVVDVSGELMGDLYRQGREIGFFKALDPQGRIANVAMTWGPQPHKGTIFFSDLHSGLWAVRLGERP